MDFKSKYNFKELCQERHSVRSFQKKEIPENLIKEILSVAHRSASWANSQPWKVYIATGEVLENIRKDSLEKGNKKEKGYSDMDPGHRTNYSKQSQKNMDEQTQAFCKFTYVSC